jgi:drug/metabolite transporter (DMT)-like permease
MSCGCPTLAKLGWAGPPQSRMRQRTQAQLLLLATVLIWGATFTLVKSALADVSPLLFNLLRFTLATVALAIINRADLRNITSAQWQAGALAGIFLAAGYQFQTLGLTRTTPAKSAFITGLVVVFVPALTLIPALRPAGAQRPGPAAALGAILAFAGLLLLTTPAGTRLAQIFVTIGLGDLLTLVCALCFAGHLLTLARVSRGMPSGLLATLQIGFATLAMLFTLPLEHPHATFTPLMILTLLICGLLGTAAAFTIQSFAQRILPPTHTVLLLTLEPVFAWLTSLVFFGEILGRRSLAGAALILAGIAIIELLPAANATEIPA